MNRDMWRRKKVFITGCTGLVGGWLADWLVEAGADVVGLIRDGVPGANFYQRGLDRRITTVRGELENAALMERALNEHEIEVVFHLGAQTIVGIANRNPLSTFTANIQGTWNLLEAARRTKTVKGFVFASSDKAYGSHDVLPYTEDAPLIGRHPYDVSKSCSDLITQSYWETYRLPVAITRCGNFYGGGDLNFNRIVPGTIRSLIDGQRPIVRSDGTMIRDYFFVKDGVGAYITTAEKLLEGVAAGQAYNFSYENQITVLDLVQIIRRVFGDTALEPVVMNEAQHEIPHQYLSAAKARQQLGWTPAYTLEASLAETIAWYRDYFKEQRA